MTKTQLPEDCAIVLQQIYEDGSDELNYLSEFMQYERGHLAQVIQSLNHKGLIIINRDKQYDVWLTISSKGKHLIKYLWPESKVVRV